MCVRKGKAQWYLWVWDLGFDYGKDNYTELQLYNAINTDLDTSFCSFENEMEGRYLILLARFFSCIFFIVLYTYLPQRRGYRINSSRTMSLPLSVLQISTYSQRTVSRQRGKCSGISFIDSTSFWKTKAISLRNSLRS